MDKITCQVFPDPGTDILGGLTGGERIAALASVFRAVNEYLMSDEGLSASPRPAYADVATGAFFFVDPAVALAKTGLVGVRQVNVAHASNAVAFTVPSLTGEIGDPPVYPVLLVDFDPETGSWTTDSASLLFFRRLSEIMGGVELVFGYSCPFDPYAASPL